MDRKDFFRKAFIGGSVLIFAPAVFSACTKASDALAIPGGSSTIDLTSSAYSSLKTVGGYAYNGNVIIIRSSATNYIALSSICTHQGCTVGYSNSANKLICPCHGAVYNTSGTVLQGPAPSSLMMYTAIVTGTTLTIK
jgi:cytochrome b6-f complex iron-sulfur subunit